MGTRPILAAAFVLTLLVAPGPRPLRAEEIAAVESIAGSARPAPDEGFVEYAWQGVVANKTLSQIEAGLALVLRAADGSPVGEVRLGPLTLERMEQRQVDAVLEVDLATWSRVHSVRAEVASARRLTEPQGASTAALVPDVRSSEERQGDLARLREQLQSKIDRLERVYGERRTDYEIIKAKIGPFGLLNPDSKDGRKLERDLERASRALQDAAQDLRQAQQQLQDIR